MGRLTLVAGSTTLALAAACAYLLIAISDAREQVRTAHAGQESARARLERAQRQISRARSPAVPASSATAIAAPPAATATPQATSELGMSQQSLAHQLSRLVDPSRQQQRLETARSNARSRWPDVRRALRLTAEQEAKLIDLFAESLMKREERMLRRMLGEPVPEDVGDLQQALHAEVAAVLGELKAAELRMYQASWPIRMDVRLLRAELPRAHRLTDQQAEQLIAALNEERLRIVEELTDRQRRGKVKLKATGWSAGGYVLLDGEPAIQSAEQQIADHHQRLAKRAAQILTPPQLAQYQALQEEDVVGMRFDYRRDLQ